MVNNEKKQRGFFYRVLSLLELTSTIIFFLFLSLQTFAQSIENRYRSHLDTNGTTFFFCPKQLGNNVNINKFIYDMTYHTSNDSVILNFTLIANRPVKVTKMVLACGDKNYVGESVGTMYADICGDKYEIRTTSKFSLKDIGDVFSQSDPLTFRLSLDGGGNASAAYSLSKWNKDSKLITRIFELINFQR